jgi:hypothetical protein
MSFFVAGIGWSSNKTATDRVDDLHGWPSKVRLYVGSQLYTSGAIPQIYTASGTGYLLSRDVSSMGEYTIIGAPSTEPFVSRKTLYCIVLSTSKDDCRSTDSVFVEYAAPIEIASIDDDESITVWSYIQQASANADANTTTAGPITSATYALTAQHAHIATGEYTFAATTKVLKTATIPYMTMADFASVEAAFKVALVEMLPLAEYDRVSVTAVAPNGVVSFVVDYTSMGNANAASLEWTAKMGGATPSTALFASRMLRAICGADYVPMPPALATPQALNLRDPSGGTVSLKTAPPTKMPTQIPTNQVSTAPTMQPTKWYSTAPIQKVCPAGTRRVMGSDIGSTLPQFVAVQGTFVCVACPKGRFQSMADQNSCEACPMGQYAATVNSPNCVVGWPQCKDTQSRMCWVSQEGESNNLEVKWQNFEAGREVTAIGWPSITNAHPKWRLIGYNLTGLQVSAITSVFDISATNVNSLLGSTNGAFAASAGSFNVAARTSSLGDSDDMSEPRPQDPIRYVRSRVAGNGFWFFKASALFANRGGGANAKVDSTHNLNLVVAEPKKPVITFAPLPQFVQPMKKITLIAEGYARPVAHARWLKDGKEIVSAAVPFEGTNFDSNIVSSVVSGTRIKFEQSVKGGNSNGGTDLANNGGAPTIVYTLTVDQAGRLDAGEYTLELTNYVGQTTSASPSSTSAASNVYTVGAKVEVACNVCDSCAAHSVPSADNSACVCADNYWNKPSDIVDYSTNPLGFECIRCPAGAICNGNPTLDEIVTKPMWYRHAVTDVSLVPCKAGGGCNYVRKSEACVGGSLLGSEEPATRRLQEEAVIRESDPNHQCVLPYTGLMCSACVPGYYLVLDDECTACPREHSMVKMKLGMRVLMTISFFFAAYVLTVIIRTPIRSNYHRQQRRDRFDQSTAGETTLNTSSESLEADIHTAGGALTDGIQEGARALENGIAKVDGKLGHMVSDAEKFAYDIFDRSDNPVTVARVKILISWLQCIGPIALTFAVQWPDEFTKHIYIVNTIFMLDFVEMAKNIGYIACEFPTDYQTGFWPHMLVFPVTCIVCGIGYYRALMLGPIDRTLNRRGKMRKEFLRHREASYARAIQCVLFFVFLWYPGLCQRLFRIFKCVDIGGTSYLAADLTVRCWEGNHDFYARSSGVFIAIYVIGIPFCIYCALMAHRNIILADRRGKKSDLARAKWGILYSCFHPEHWYFELVDMLRKGLLAGGLVLVEYDSPVQTLIGVLVCLAFVTFHLKVAPYRLKVDNLFQDITSWHLLFTLLIGLWITASRSVGIAGLTMGTSVYEEKRTNDLLLTLFYVTLLTFSFMFVLLIPGVRRCMQPMLQCLNQAFCLSGTTLRTGTNDGRSPSPTRRRNRSGSPAKGSPTRDVDQVQMTIEGDAGVGGVGGGGEMVYQYTLEDLSQMYPMATQEQLLAMQQEQQYAAMQQQQQQEEEMAYQQQQQQQQQEMAYQDQQLDMALSGGMDGQQMMSGARSPNQMEDQLEAEAYMNTAPVQFGHIEEKITPAVKTGAIYQF